MRYNIRDPKTGRFVKVNNNSDDNFKVYGLPIWLLVILAIVGDGLIVTGVAWYLKN